MHSNLLVAVLFACLVVGRSTPVPDDEDDHFVFEPGRLTKDIVLKDRFAAVPPSQLHRDHAIESLESEEADAAKSEESEEKPAAPLTRHQLLLQQTPVDPEFDIMIRHHRKQYDPTNSTGSSESSESVESARLPKFHHKGPFHRHNHHSASVDDIMIRHHKKQHDSTNSTESAESSESAESTDPPKFHHKGPFHRHSDHSASAVIHRNGFFHPHITRSADRPQKLKSLCSRIFATESLALDAADADDFNEKMRRLEAICHRIFSGPSMERHGADSWDSSTKKPRPFKKPFRTTTEPADVSTTEVATEAVAN